MNAISRVPAIIENSEPLVHSFMFTLNQPAQWLHFTHSVHEKAFLPLGPWEKNIEINLPGANFKAPGMVFIEFILINWLSVLIQFNVLFAAGGSMPALMKPLDIYLHHSHLHRTHLDGPDPFTFFYTFYSRRELIKVRKKCERFFPPSQPSTPFGLHLWDSFFSSTQQQRLRGGVFIIPPNLNSFHLNR